AGLRGHVGRQVRLTAVGRHRDDVDDGAAYASGDHVLDCGLHEEERPTQIDGDVLVEELGGGVEHRAAGRQTRTVHQSVDAAEPIDRLRDRSPALADVPGIGPDVQNL